MAGNWSVWLGQVDRVETLETIVYLGAGYGADVPALVQTATRRIVLVEPNPAFQHALTDAAADDDRITVQPLALAETTGSTPFQVLNFAAHSSLRTPSGLYSLFPGLRVQDTPMVDTVTLTDLLNRLGLAADKTHVLIMDVPGDSAMILEQLAGMAENPFAHLLICDTSQTLYDTQPEIPDLPSSLTAWGYAMADVQRHDPAFPRYWMRRNPVQLELDRLRAQQTDTARLERDLIEAQRMRALHDADMTDLRQRHAALVEEKNELEALLRQVTVRLMIASDHLHQTEPAQSGLIPGTKT